MIARPLLRCLPAFAATLLLAMATAHAQIFRAHVSSNVNVASTTSGTITPIPTI